MARSLPTPLLMKRRPEAPAVLENGEPPNPEQTQVSVETSLDAPKNVEAQLTSDEIMLELASMVDAEDTAIEDFDENCMELGYSNALSRSNYGNTNDAKIAEGNPGDAESVIVPDNPKLDLGGGRMEIDKDPIPVPQRRRGRPPASRNKIIVQEHEPLPPRRRGRPRRSNTQLAKDTVDLVAESVVQQFDTKPQVFDKIEPSTTVVVPVRRRGRPPGSRNKPQAEKIKLEAIEFGLEPQIAQVVSSGNEARGRTISKRVEKIEEVVMGLNEKILKLTYLAKDQVHVLQTENTRMSERIEKLQRKNQKLKEELQRMMQGGDIDAIYDKSI